jgi:hypothetical protein
MIDYILSFILGSLCTIFGFYAYAFGMFKKKVYRDVEDDY